MQCACPNQVKRTTTGFGGCGEGSNSVAGALVGAPKEPRHRPCSLHADPAGHLRLFPRHQTAGTTTPSIPAPVPPIHRRGRARHLAQFGHVLPRRPPSQTFPIVAISTNNTTWSLAALVVRGMLRRPPVRPVLLCPPSAWWQKKNAAHHAHMIRHGVDRIEGQLKTWQSTGRLHHVERTRISRSPRSLQCVSQAPWTKPMTTARASSTRVPLVVVSNGCRQFSSDQWSPDGVSPERRGTDPSHAACGGQQRPQAPPQSRLGRWSTSANA